MFIAVFHFRARPNGDLEDGAERRRQNFRALVPSSERAVIIEISPDGCDEAVSRVFENNHSRVMAREGVVRPRAHP